VLRPPIFQDATYVEARRRAAAAGRWAIVVATSPSSELGAMMDRTTWRDERVCAWLEQKAFAVQVDVAEDELLGRRLRPRTLPAVIAFKDGTEAWLEGFRDAHHVLLWLASLEGKLARPAPLQSEGGDLERDMRGRLAYAKALLKERRHPEATEHFAWLWENMERVEPAMSGVRVSFMAGQMERLAAAHRPARERFAALRSWAAAAAAAEPASATQRRDWVVLNKILGEEDRTLAWFDGIAGDPASRPVVDGVAHLLVDLLKAKGRWADLGRLFRDPLEELSFQHWAASVDLPAVPGMPDDANARVRAVMVQQFRNAAATLVASLSAAGRAAEAQEVRDEALRLEPSDEMRTTLAEGASVPGQDGARLAPGSPAQ
jgi:hypothetical protein